MASILQAITLFLLLAGLPVEAQTIRAIPVAQAVIEYFPAEARQEAMCVIYFETRERPYDPTLVGDHGWAFGLLQIRTDAHPEFDPERLFEVEYNIGAGAQIWEASGRTFQRDWIIASGRCRAR